MKNIRFDSIWKTWIHVSFDGGVLRMEDVKLLSFDFQVSKIENESGIIFINH